MVHSENVFFWKRKVVKVYHEKRRQSGEHFFKLISSHCSTKIDEERLSLLSTESISLVFIVDKRADDFTAQSSPSE